MSLTPQPAVACSLFLICVLSNFSGSLIFLMLGLWFLETRRPYEPMFGHNFYSLCVWIFIGCVSVGCVTSMLGAAAVLAAKRWQILMYACLVSLCALTMCGVGITSLFFHDRIRQIIDVSLKKTMTEYYGMPGYSTLTSSVDALQDSMPCCGYVLYNDWINANLFRDQTERNGISVPLSCCLPEFRADVNPRCNEGFPFPISPRKLHQKVGCLPLLESWYRDHSFAIGAVASSVAAFFFLSCCTAMHYFRDINSRLKMEEALVAFQRAEAPRTRMKQTSSSLN
uniref:Tetraspanin n=1 Tax=Macrostomum lignano TaxID=282301 RepID=A0A1I8GH84_9PLAT